MSKSFIKNEQGKLAKRKSRDRRLSKNNRTGDTGKDYGTLASDYAEISLSDHKTLTNPE